MSVEKQPSGLTPKEIAAITACVPCSGNPYIDAIITQGLRFRTATAAMESLLIADSNDFIANGGRAPIASPEVVAKNSIKYADALIAAFRAPTPERSEGEDS